MAGAGGPRGARKDSAIEHTLPVSLEDLYRGVTKRLKLSRSVLDVSGKSKRLEVFSVQTLQQAPNISCGCLAVSKCNCLYTWCPASGKPDSTALYAAAQETITVEVKPGWKKGTRVTFENKGDERPGVAPADVVFVIEEKPHPRFRREGNDLIITHRLKLADALCGCSFTVQSLDGRTIPVTLSGRDPHIIELVLVFLVHFWQLLFNKKSSFA